MGPATLTYISTTYENKHWTRAWMQKILKIDNSLHSAILEFLLKNTVWQSDIKWLGMIWHLPLKCLTWKTCSRGPMFVVKIHDRKNLHYNELPVCLNYKISDARTWVFRKNDTPERDWETHKETFLFVISLLLFFFFLLVKYHFFVPLIIFA